MKFIDIPVSEIKSVIRQLNVKPKCGSKYVRIVIENRPDSEFTANFAGEPERIWNTQSEDLGDSEASRGIDIQSAAINEDERKSVNERI